VAVCQAWSRTDFQVDIRFRGELPKTPPTCWHRNAGGMYQHLLDTAALLKGGVDRGCFHKIRPRADDVQDFQEFDYTVPGDTLPMSKYDLAFQTAVECRRDARLRRICTGRLI
jgi:hypothetical protein